MLIYFIIAFLATIIGATAGMGGGVIIKPMLDLLGDYDITTIAILSSITVLSMALVSTGKQIKKGFIISKTIVFATVGAVFGGILGSQIFNIIKCQLDPNLVTVIQSIVLIVLLTFTLFYEKLPKYHIKSVVIKGLIGLALGLLSSFLGIGGGPINVAIFVILFNMKLRDAAKVSVFIILFAQISGLITKALNGSFALVMDYSMLYVMIPAAILGGLIGSTLNHTLTEKKIHIMFKLSVSLIIMICLYNTFNNLGMI